MTHRLRVERLTSKDRDAGHTLFKTMAEVFSEDHEALSDSYVDRLLGREDFWAGRDIDIEILGRLAPRMRATHARRHAIEGPRPARRRTRRQQPVPTSPTSHVAQSAAAFFQ